MLSPTYLHKDQVDKLMLLSFYNETNKYYYCSEYTNYENISNDKTSNYNEISMVSISDDDKTIHGILYAYIDRPERKISNMSMIKFKEDSILFGLDFLEFLRYIFFERNMYKVEFGVIIGNPVEKMYDKFIKKYGGKVIGIKKKTRMLADGKYYDRKLYEI